MVTMMRVMYEFPKNFQKLLSSMEVRVFVMLSLSLQIALFFLGSKRKRTSSRLVTVLVWTAYLSADAVAISALGFLSNSPRDEEYKEEGRKSHLSSYYGSSSSSSSSGKSEPNDHLLAFWAPFLLLHLGGPDTITSFSLEDNALWLRHGLTLVFQILVAIYIFIRSLPFTRLWLPSALMFVAGILKYGERTVALYYASTEGLKNSLITEPVSGLDYRKLMNAYVSKLSANLPVRIEMEPEPVVSVPVESNSGSNNNRSQLQLLESAYKFSNTFKLLIVDHILSFHDRNESQSFFIHLEPEEAFQVIEMELNFVYDTIYTKAFVAHTHQGRILRLVCTGCIASVFVLFFMASKTGFHRMDIAITYVLLYGAMALDFAALVIHFTSEWSSVTLKDSKMWSWRTFVAPKVLKFLRCSAIQKRLRRISSECFNPFKFIEDYLSKRNNSIENIKNLFTARWSRSMGQYNLITFCISDKKSSKLFFFKKILEFCHLKKSYDGWRYTNYVLVSDDLKKLIFDMLVTSAKDSKGYKGFCSFRGEWALERRGCRRELGWSVQMEFDASLLIWHIATDICSIHDDEDQRNPQKPESDNSGHNTQTSQSGRKTSPEDDSCRKTAKEISDYLLYILVCQPLMLSSTGVIGEIRYGDTCAEAMAFFKREETNNEQSACKEPTKNKKQSACKEMLTAIEYINPKELERKRIQAVQSVFWDACILAKSLQALKNNKWAIISDVWVEMLSYAATQCGGTFHARRLSAGGELLTFVWLLMAHLGLGAQFRADHRNDRFKLVVEK